MAAPAKKDSGVMYSYEARDKKGKLVKGGMKANGESMVSSALRRQGLTPVKIQKPSMFKKSHKIGPKDIAMFTRQMSTMMKAGVPLLQSFEIVAKGNSNDAVAALLLEIKGDIETGSSMSAAFAKHPVYFDRLYCSLLAAGEQAGILETLLDRLAEYKEKSEALKSKIKKALFYPIAIVAVAVIITAVIMIFVVPAFKDIFKNFGADLPAPTVVVIGISDFVVKYWWIIAGFGYSSGWLLFQVKKKSIAFQNAIERIMMKMPIVGPLMIKSSIARWCRTLATMFSAGVPLVESLESVAGAAGNQTYSKATRKIQSEVSQGISLTVSMQNTEVFPNMVIQMVAIGEESGSLDAMLSKVAEFYEQEVDDMVDGLSSLMEPIIMAVLGVVVGGLVVAMYLPIFKMGQVVK